MRAFSSTAMLPMLALACLFAACRPAPPSGGDIAAQAPAAQAPADQQIPPPQSSAGPAAQGAEPGLQPVSGDALTAAALPGELACSFAVEDAPGPLLVAAGDVASQTPAQGLLEADAQLVRVSAPGGFDAIWRGARFEGAGATVEIHLTGAARGGGESPPRPARLDYRGPDGTDRSYTGLWSCGP